MTSHARNAILDLVLGIILPNKRHPNYVSNCCDGALFEELCNHDGFFFIGTSTKRIKWCAQDGLSSSHVVLSNWNESVLQDGLDAERTAPMKYIFLPIVRNQNVPINSRTIVFSTRGVLETLGSKPRIF